MASENYLLLLLALLSHRHTSSNHLYFSPEPGQQATTAAKTIRAARTEEVHHTALQQRKRPASSHLRSRETERSIATTYCVAPKAPRTRSATAQCDQELTTAPGTTEQHPADTPPPPPPSPISPGQRILLPCAELLLVHVRPTHQTIQFPCTYYTAPSPRECRPVPLRPAGSFQRWGRGSVRIGRWARPASGFVTSSCCSLQSVLDLLD